MTVTVIEVCSYFMHIKTVMLWNVTSIIAVLSALMCRICCVPLLYKKLIRRWIANVNFLYDDIVHVLQNTIDSCINSATDRRGGYVLEHMFTKFSERTQCNGHYAIQGHRFWYQSQAHIRLPNCNLPPILHRFQVTADYCQIFASERGVPHFTLSLGEIPCQYRHKWYIVKNYILWPTFLPQKVSMYLQQLLRNPPRKLPNSVKLRSR